MIADSVEFLAGHGRRVLVDMEHFFDGYKAQPRVLAAGARGGGRQGRQPRRAVRHQRRLAAPRGRRDRRRRARPRRRRRHRSASTATTTPAARSPTRWPPCCAGAGHVQGTLNGLGERTGNANLTTIIPNLQLKLGYTCLPDGRIERLTAVSHHVAETAQPRRQPAGAVRRVVGVRPQGRAATSAPSPGPRTPTSTSTPSSSATAPASSVSEMAGRATIQMKADELGLTMDGAGGQPGDRRPQAARARGLPLRGGRRLARAADAPGRRLGAGLLPGREHAGDHRRAAERRLHHRGDGQGVGRRRRGAVFDRRGQRPGQRHRHRAARRASAAPTRSSTGCTSPTTRCASSTAAGATGAVTRVLLDATDGERDWTTIGVSPNIIEASWRALEESLVYGLLHASTGG